MHLIHLLFELSAIAAAGINPALTADERAALKARLAAVREALPSIQMGELAPQGLASGDLIRLRDTLAATEAAL